LEISANLVKELRALTGAGVIDCRNALAECRGDLQKAQQLLRARGLAAAGRRSGRVAKEGLVTSYIHAEGRLGVLVEINCETDFVARTDPFQELVRDVAMHIAAADPRFVHRDEVTPEVLERERAIFREQAAASGKPPAVIERIVTGKLEKYYSESVLLEQPFVKDPDHTVGQMIAERIGRMGENIRVRRFARYQLGEGIEKRQDDFAGEVARAVK
jgi:elongation factor Ts